jgi:ParB family chromosome partitioning protein
VTIKRQALGRGLAALIPGAAPPEASVAQEVQRRPAEAPREGLRTVGIEDIHPMRGQPRKSFDDARIDELAASIRAQGIIQPLIVRLRDGGGYELIAGERRWRAAQRAGLHEVQVVVRDTAAAAAFELAMVENLQRQDLNPIEEAEGFDRLIRDFGYTQESLAARVGKDRTTVTNALRLLKLPSGVRALVIAGRLSMGHARAILGLETLATGALEAMERMARVASTRELSVRQVEQLVRRERETPAEVAPEAPVRATASARDLETRLSRTLGTRVRVVEAGPGRGQLAIHYSSLDELDRILGKLMP